MGGCVSMDGVTSKLFSKSKASAKIGETEFIVVQEIPINIESSALVIPVFNLDVLPETALIMNGTPEEKAKATEILKTLFEGSAVKTQLRSEHIAEAKAPEGDSKIKTVIFLYVDQNKSGADRIHPAMNRLFALAQAKKFEDITIVKLHKEENGIGLKVTDTVNEICVASKIKFEKEASTIKKVIFASTDDAYTDTMAACVKELSNKDDGGMFSGISMPKMPEFGGDGKKDSGGFFSNLSMPNIKMPTFGSDAKEEPKKENTLEKPKEHK